MARQTQKRLAVAVLLSSGEQFSAFFGGALARWTYEVYRCLTERVEVQVFGFPTAPADRYPMPHESSAAWRACRVMAQVPLLRRYEEEVWLRALLGRLRNFDLIHIHNRPQWIPMLRRLGYRGALLLHLQNDHLGHWTSAMLEELAPQLEGVAVCSGFLRDTFVPKSPALAAKTHVVFNGVNLQMFYPREETRESKTIFFVGRFDREKGVLQLVQAFARVLENHPDAKLVIGGATGFGTHEETPYVREVRAEALGLESRHPGCVRFPGYIHHDNDLPAWFQRATIFTSPSLFREPFGLVNAEAMACGTPVVGARRGGIPEVVGEAGILVDPEDTPGFAAALAQLLAQPERRALMGRAGLSRVREMFDWKVIAENWAALLYVVCALSAVEMTSPGQGSSVVS